MKSRAPLHVLGILVAFAAAILTAACEKVPLLAPTGSTITLTSASTVVAANGSATIIAQVLESSGTPPHSGTRVTFTTTLGTIEPSEASTDASGRVTVTFHAGGGSGIATIAAASGGATTSTGSTSTGSSGTTTTTDRSLKIAVGTAAVGRVNISASPTLIPAQNTAVTVIATVYDINGNALPSVPVLFSTTAGTLNSSSVMTDAQGVAVTAVSTAVETTVTATAGLATPPSSGGTTGTASANTATVTIKVNPIPTLSIVPATQGTLTAGSVVAFTITATLPQGSTAQVRRLTLDYGDGSGIKDLGPATGTITVQHVYGNADRRSYSVTVTLEDTLGAKTTASTEIVVFPEPPLSVSINVSSTPNGTNTIYTFTATVTPASETIISYLWTIDGTNPQVTTNNQLIQTFATGTVHTIGLTVTTSTGRTSSATRVVP